MRPVAFAVLLSAAPALAQLAPPLARPQAIPERGASVAEAVDQAIAEEAGPAPTGPGARMMGLDKFSALSRPFFAPLGEAVEFGRLRVSLRDCAASADGPAAWLEITDEQAGDAPVFAGWMFADSPAVSALDNPRYDVWLISCATR